MLPECCFHPHCKQNTHRADMVKGNVPDDLLWQSQLYPVWLRQISVAEMFLSGRSNQIEHISNIMSFTALLKIEQLFIIYSLVETIQNKLRGQDRILSLELFYKIRENCKSSAFSMGDEKKGSSDESNLPHFQYHSQKSEE